LPIIGTPGPEDWQQARVRCLTLIPAPAGSDRNLKALNPNASLAEHAF